MLSNSYISTIKMESVVVDNTFKPVSEAADNLNIAFKPIAQQKTDGADIDTSATTDNADLKNIAVKNMVWHNPSNGSHGILTKADNAMAITIPSGKKADITILGCQYGSKAVPTAIGSDGSVLKIAETIKPEDYVNGEANAPEYIVLGAEGTVTLSFVSSMWIHNLKVNYWAAGVTDKYTIKVTADDKQGSASTDKVFAAAGEEITLTATPKSGYVFKEWKAVKGNVTSFTNNKFTMPGGDVEIQAVFEKTGPRTEWDFTNTADTTLYNANNTFIDTATSSGELAGLKIDATAKDAKFQPNSGGYVQVNKDTKIKVPVTGIDTGDGVKVTVQWYVGAVEYTVAGVTYTSGTGHEPKTVECKGTKEADSDDKYVEIVYTGQSASTYLDLIKIEPIAYVASGTIDFTNDSTHPDIFDIIGLTTTAADFSFKGNGGHGYQSMKADASIKLNLKEKANITVKSCQYNGPKKDEMTASSGKVTKDTAKDPSLYVLGAEKGELTLTFGKGVYIHSINVSYASDEGYKDLFVIDVTNDGYGTAEADKIYASTNEEVTLTATASSGYKFKEWNVVEGGVSVTDDKFRVGTAHVKIQATFELAGSRFEWDFANDETLTGANGIVVDNKKEDVADLTIDATATGSKWDSTVEDGWVVVNNGTKIEVPLDGVNAEECEDGKYRVTVIGKTANYKVNGEAATKAEAAESFFCEGTDGKVVIEATADNNISYIKVSPLVYIKAGTVSFGDEKTINTTKGLTVSNITWHDATHGLETKTGNGVPVGTMELSLSKKANISVVTCCHGVGNAGNMKASSGSVTNVETTEEGKTGLEWTVLGADPGDLTLTFDDFTDDGSMFIHSITVDYPQEILPGSRNIDVWDFAGKREDDTDTMKYNNNMTAETIKASGAIGSDGLFGDGKNAVFGDLTMFYNENDRFYSTVVTDIARTDSQSFVEVDYDDGYTSAGGFYCNGTGGSIRRYITISNVQAGDKIVAYMGLTNAASQYFFEGSGTAAGQKDEVDADTGGGIKGFQKYEFVAEKTGTYKIWENAIGKPMYHRIVRVPGVTVRGTVNLGSYNVADYSVKFVNTTNQKETLATLDGNDFSAVLAPGFTYTAVMSDASGYGFTTASKMVTTVDSEYKTGKSGIELVVETKNVYNYTGQIKGFAQDYNIKDLEIRMIPPEGSYLDKIKLNIDENLNFNAVLDSNVEYTIQLDGVDDYEVKNGTVVKKNDDYNADIEVGLKPKYEVSGNFIVLDGSALPSSATVTSLKFAILDSKGKENAKYVYDATIADGGYSTVLRNGEYIAKAVISGYTTTTHVVVNNAALERDLMFVSGTVDTTPIDYAADIYVGYKDKTENSYATVSAAMDACERMTRTSGQRVTVHIAPGVYREQIFVKAPNITFVNDTPGKQVLLTWYYGIGYKYYSADSKGYYNPQNAYDKHDKHIAEKWGVAVYVQSDATAFRAEGITFENSFNRYVTSEEIADGVEKDTIKFDRTYNADVECRDAIERAAAMIIEADEAEFKDCGFYSSQDTLYTAETNVHGYFKNCVIEGNTDYIYGGGNYVFDGCELSWKGYSDSTKQGGYITAVRPAAGNKGYLFRNCVITANEGYTVNPGYFGRNWGADAKVVMLNTKLEKETLIDAAGWYKMNGDPALSNYFEYNTTTTAGVAVDTSKRVRGVIDATAAAEYTAESFFGGWKPEYYTDEAEGDVTFAADSAPKLISNAAAGSASKPGNILTVSYSLGEANDKNDASIIQWYRVDGSNETLIKTSNASDKTYLIDAADVGKKIIVTVIPAVSSGKVGTSASDTLESNVEDGYDETVDFSILPSITSNANINVPHPDDILTVSYSLDAANLSKDASEIVWYSVKGEEVKEVAKTTAPVKTYTIKPEDVGCLIRVEVTPANSNGTKNDDAKASYTLKNAVTDRNSSPVNVVSEPYANPDPKAGAVEKDTMIELKCTTGGASIYYNINSDSNPTADEGTLYNAEIKITNSIIKNGHVIIKAIAVKEGLENSKVVTLNYTVNAGDDSGLIINFVDEGEGTYEYTGSAIKPEIEVRNNGIPLVPGTDYTVKYSNNINVPATGATKKPTVTVTGKGILTGKATQEFTITPKSFEDETGENKVVAGRIVVAVNKKVPVPSVYYGSTKLKVKKDFTYTAPDPYTAVTDDAKITITGAGNFKDTLEVPVKVVADAQAVKTAAKKFNVSVNKEKAKAIIYNGGELETEIKAAIEVKTKDSAKTDLTANAAENYILVLPKDITNAGTVKFTVVGIGEYSGCNVTKSCKILPRTIAKENVVIDKGGAVAADGKVLVSGITDKATFASTGATFPEMALTYGSDKLDMKLGVDYKVSYSSNKKVNATAKAKYTITFMGNYKGKYASDAFDINKAELDTDTAVVVIPDMVCNGKDGIYKAKPYVTINNVTLKASEYKVTYYLDEAMTTEMDKNNKLSLGELSSKPVYVKVEPSAKSNYQNTDTTKTITGSYTVWKKGSKDTDLSKAKVTFYEGTATKATKKLSYTGDPIELIKLDDSVTPTDGNRYIKVEVNKKTVPADAYEVEYVSNVNKGKATVVIKPADTSAQDDTTTAYTGGKVATFTIAARKLENKDWFSAVTEALGF